SVAHPDLATALDAILVQRYGFATLWVRGEPMAAGVRNAYQTPTQLGADRWVSMLGLAQHALNHASPGGPLMLASFGTATTIDTLLPLPASAGGDAQFVFEGGLILPGPALMGSSLATGTARLPRVEGPVCTYPLDTQQAIS